VKRVNAGGWILNPTIVVDGEVVGTWKRIMKMDGVAITRSLFRPLKKHRSGSSDAEERYAAFVSGKKVHAVDFRNPHSTTGWRKKK